MLLKHTLAKDRFLHQPLILLNPWPEYHRESKNGFCNQYLTQQSYSDLLREKELSLYRCSSTTHYYTIQYPQHESYVQIIDTLHYNLQPAKLITPQFLQHVITHMKQVSRDRSTYVMNALPSCLSIRSWPLWCACRFVMKTYLAVFSAVAVCSTFPICFCWVRQSWMSEQRSLNYDFFRTVFRSWWMISEGVFAVMTHVEVIVLIKWLILLVCESLSLWLVHTVPRDSPLHFLTWREERELTLNQVKPHTLTHTVPVK